MNVSIVRACELTSHPDLHPEVLKACALPHGFPYLIVEETGEIVDCYFEYLIDKHGSRYVGNSATASADDLKDWTLHLQAKEIGNVLDAVIPDIEEYRDLMGRLISPKTHEPYRKRTVLRRVGTAIDFYKFARRKGWIDWDFPQKSILRIPPRQDFLAHVPKATAGTSHGLFRGWQTSPDEEVRALLPQQYRMIARQLGPLPPTGGADMESDYSTDGRSVRDRLWAELCVHPGMRPSEPLALSRFQILALSAGELTNELGVQSLRIVGKGGKHRTVQIPNFLVKGLLWYIEEEREDVVKLAREKGNLRAHEDPAQLFLNGVTARHNVGRPLQYGTLRDAFARAVHSASRLHPDAGLLRSRSRIDPITRNVRVDTAGGFTPHCLRHTYAVVTYFAERAAGNPEPWKVLQVRLGHASVQTTMDIYLRVTGEYEAQVSDRVLSHLSSMFYGPSE